MCFSWSPRTDPKKERALTPKSQSHPGPSPLPHITPQPDVQEPPPAQPRENRTGSRTGTLKSSKIIAPEVLKALVKLDKETEAQRRYMSYPRSHSKLVAEPGWLLQSTR